MHGSSRYEPRAESGDGPAGCAADRANIDLRKRALILLVSGVAADPSYGCAAISGASSARSPRAWATPPPRTERRPPPSAPSARSAWPFARDSASSSLGSARMSSHPHEASRQTARARQPETGGSRQRTRTKRGHYPWARGYARACEAIQAAPEDYARGAVHRYRETPQLGC